jgi:hypothetical protein
VIPARPPGRRSTGPAENGNDGLLDFKNQR